MKYLLMVFLCAFFAYALGLVILNNNEVAVNLLFMQAPAMNLGLLLIVCIFLGMSIGILLALLMFKVLQNKWEISRLKKENGKLEHKLDTSNDEVNKLKVEIDAVKLDLEQVRNPTPPADDTTAPENVSNNSTTST